MSTRPLDGTGSVIAGPTVPRSPYAVAVDESVPATLLATVPAVPAGPVGPRTPVGPRAPVGP
jgi:hypothetical protein